MLPLPEDDGFCLFHSRDKKFKKKHDFSSHFQQFLEFSNAHPDIELIDLRGMHIDSGDDLIFKNITFLKELNISNAHVQDALTFEHCRFDKGVFLDNIHCFDILSVKHCHFNDRFTATDGAYFDYNVHLEDVRFGGLFDVNNARFAEQVNVRDVSFEGQTVFDQARFAGENSFSYFRAEFMEYTSFLYTRFEGPVQFERCKFYKEANFDKTGFSQRFHLDAPFIEGNLFFKGMDKDHKIFETEVEMIIGEDSFNEAGQIIFQNADLTYLDKETKAMLATLKQNRRVVLGEGTIVFRFSFKEHYPYSVLTEVFLSDLLSKIKQYFDYRRASHFEFVLSKEILDIESQEESLVVTFYTDEYATSTDFKKEQFKGVKELLSNQSDDEAIKYIQENFMRIVETALKEGLSEDFLMNILSVNNLNVYDSQIQEVRAKQLNVSTIQNSPIYVGLIKLDNQPEFKLTESQFKELKIELGASKVDFEEIKDQLHSIISAIEDGADPGPLKDQLKDFLADSGIGMARSIGGAAIFLVLRALVGV